MSKKIVYLLKANMYAWPLKSYIYNSLHTLYIIYKHVSSESYNFPHIDGTHKIKSPCNSREQRETYARWARVRALSWDWVDWVRQSQLFSCFQATCCLIFKPSEIQLQDSATTESLQRIQSQKLLLHIRIFTADFMKETELHIFLILEQK